MSELSDFFLLVGFLIFDSELPLGAFTNSNSQAVSCDLGVEGETTSLSLTDSMSRDVFIVGSRITTGSK